MRFQTNRPYHGRFPKLTDLCLLPIAVRTLPGGAMLYHIPSDTPLVLLEVVMRTGSIHEGADAGCGVSHFLEHMLFQGCSRYPGNSASERVHELGGECNAYTAFDHTAYYLELPAEKLADGLDILASMVAEPLFPEEKFISEKSVIAREADMIFDRPEQILVQNLWQQVFTVHPARFPIVGYPDKIAGVSREQMQHYYERRYGAMRSHWLVAGNVDPDRVQALLAEKLAGFTRGNLDEPMLTAEPEQQFERELRGTFADPMARIALGVRTPPASDRITPALDLLTGIIGQNSSSRLVRTLWQERELAISLSSSGYTANFGGVFGVNAACEPKKLSELEAGIREILAEVHSHGVTAAELEREKLQQRTHFYRTLETARETLAIVNDGVLNYGAPEHIQDYLSRLEALTLDEVNAAAADYLNPRRFAWSILAPPKTGHAKTKAASSATPKGGELHTGKLTSGAGYAILPRGVLPLDDLLIVLPAGPVWEADYHNGVGALLAEMLTSGPADWSESEFYDLLDNNGIELAVNCGHNTFSIELNFPAAARALAEKVFTRLLLNPRWDAGVFAREKSNLCEQLGSRLMDPRFAAMHTARQALFGNHPAGYGRLGTPESLQAITVDEVKAFYYARFAPEWVKFGATVPRSNTAIQKSRTYFEKLSSKLSWRDVRLARPVKIKFDTAEALPPPLTVDLPREQSAVLYALPGCTADSPEHYAMELLDTALNGLSSHLFKEVREKRSLAYSTGCAINFGLAPGMIALYAGVSPERTREALDCLSAEAARLASEGFSKAEFEAARLGAISSMSRRLEEVDARLLSVLLSMFYGEKPECGLRGPERLAKIRFAECNRMIKKIFAQMPQISVIAGPGATAAFALPQQRKRSSRRRSAEQPELPLNLAHHGGRPRKTAGKPAEHHRQTNAKDKE